MKNPIAQLSIFFIRGLRPLLGPAQCKFPVTCTRYAIVQLQDKPFIPATWAIIKRVFSCNPFYKSSAAR